MDWTLVIGLTVIIFAYGSTCLLIIKSKKIIEKISKKRFKNVREIKKELSL